MALQKGLAKQSVSAVLQAIRPRWTNATNVIADLFADALVCRPKGGYFLSLRIKSDLSEAALLQAARSKGLVLTKGSAFVPGLSAEASRSLFVRLPFHALEPEVFSQGAERLVGCCHVNCLILK